MADPSEAWELVYRPRRTPRIVIIVAVVVLAIHIIFGALLTIRDTGVRNIGLGDQLAIMLIGVVVSGAILLFTRSRLRVGPTGVGVRNLVSERVFDWDRVRGITYPEKGFSARLLLPDDEHVPVLAIQANDGDRAVEVMNAFRELQDRYGQASRPAP